MVLLCVVVFFFFFYASGCTQVWLAMFAVESSSVNFISYFTYESYWLWENHSSLNIMHLCCVVFLPVLPKWTHTNVPYVFVNAVLLICTIICIIYRVPKCDVIKFSFLHFSIFMTIFQQNMMKNPNTPNLTWIGSWWPDIWPQEYLISPIEIRVNWPGSKQ